MPRPAGKVPAYCRHKASGQAVVRIDGRDEYLGPYGSAESHSRYEQLIAEWRVRQLEQAAAPCLAAFNLTITEVLQRYRQFAEGYYTKAGRPTKELAEMRYALRPVRELYGETPAREFGPLKLKAVRQRMIDGERLSRGVINQRVKRIKRLFKWAVSEELVPPSVAQGLATVAGLRKGRTTARETPPVQPVDDAWVELVLPHLSPQVAGMVQLQRLTGMRPCEVVLLRACDIDRTEDVWIYEPLEHKNEWRGHSRLVPLGPKAQQILAPLLTADAERYVFSPRDAEAWRNERRAQQRRPDRKTKIYPCELRARE
jgi:integrase